MINTTSLGLRDMSNFSYLPTYNIIYCRLQIFKRFILQTSLSNVCSKLFCFDGMIVTCIKEANIFFRLDTIMLLDLGAFRASPKFEGKY